MLDAYVGISIDKDIEVKFPDSIWFLSSLLSKKASSDGNATVSILSFRPKMEHIGKSLVCKATNPLISQSDLFDNMDLNIDCKYCLF